VLKRKAAIGDILEIKTPAGLAYLQYTHEHPSMGALVRILPGLYQGRPRDFTDLSRQRELYFTFYTLEYALPKRETEIVSHQPVPDCVSREMAITALENLITREGTGDFARVGR
jgi:hypothetical protein